MSKMTQDEYMALLADYLGNELNERDLARFTAYLADHPDAQAEVSELHETLDELGQLQTVSHSTATAATSSLALSTPSSRSRFPRILTGAAKVAAVLIFGILVGRMTAPTESAPMVPAARLAKNPALASAAPVHPGWIELAQRLDGNQASLGAQLRVLANLPR